MSAREEVTVSLCGACCAIAPTSAWQVTAGVAATDGTLGQPPLLVCPACGTGYDVADSRAECWSGSWPAMARRRLDLIGGES